MIEQCHKKQQQTKKWLYFYKAVVNEQFIRKNDLPKQLFWAFQYSYPQIHESLINIMQKQNKFQLNVDQVAKLNSWLPKGYKIISFEENTKRLTQLKKMQKISYVPIQQIKPVEPSVSRRPKNNVSYYEGDEIGQVASMKGAVQDYQPENPKIRSKTHEPDYYQTNKQKTSAQMDRQSSSGVQKKVQSQVPKYIPTSNQELQMFLPPVFSKSPLTPKQMLQELEQHSKFYVIRQFETDWPQKKLFEILMKKIESNSYGLQQFLQDMNNLFINIYGSYPRSSSMYNDTGELEGYLTVLLNTQKGKIKQPKLSKELSNQASYTQDPIPSLIPQMSIGSQPLSQLRQSSAPQFQRKKTVPMQKPDTKNITIMDKRILGQNIKKLPNECLPEICRIVFQTLETREEYIIDIDTLPIKKVKELQTYVNMCMSRFGDFEADNEIRNEGDSSESSFIIEDDFD